MTRTLRSLAPLAALLWTVSSAAPAAGAPQLPDLQHRRLLNDLQIVSSATPSLGESMTIGLVIRYGSAYDPADKGGLAYVVSQLLGKATMDRTGKDVADELAYLGASLEVRTDWDGIRLLLKGQSSRFERSLLVLYQMVGEAVFTDADFAALRQSLLKRFEAEPDPRRRARSQFEEALFRGTTFGRSIEGGARSIGNITVGDVRQFHRRFFSPSAAALVIVSSAPQEVMMQKAARIWGVWVRRDDVPYTFLPPRTPSSRPVVLVDEPASPAAQFILGGLWPSRDDTAFLPAVAGARVLEARLTRALPTSLVPAGWEGRRMTGPFYIQGQAAADQTVAEIEKILQTVESFRATTVAAEELASVKTRLLEDYRKTLTTTQGICEVLLEGELYRLGTNVMASYPEAVQRITPESVREASKQWAFPNGVLIYVRGPAATLKPGLERLGPLQP